MIRIIPKAWTAVHMAASGLAVWLLCNMDALGGMPPLFVH